LDFIEGAVPIFGEGNVRSLLMVGIEPLEDTLRGVEVLAERGCDPVLSPFRPDPSTPMRNEKPPNVDFLIETYERAKEITGRFSGVKLGPRCIPCHHNTLTFPDNSEKYYFS
ncbi:MAG: radical SAM protein, partial [Candidatus Nanoarchaeia archaeon]